MADPALIRGADGMVSRFIAWAVKQAPHAQRVVTFDGKFLFNRYEFLRLDEWPDHLWDKCREKYPSRPNKLPWWLPFNAFVHCWEPEPGTREGFHDHPRWSVTVCLKGRITEVTPWGRRELRPGSVVIRSRKAIHAFEVPVEHAGAAWTLFVVGRRKHRQNTYVVTAQ
jgi:hypothetical protein